MSKTVAYRHFLNLSPLTRRILAVNIFAVAILGGGLLYLSRYQDQLIQAELNALQNQAQIVAAALAEGAVVRGPGEASEIAEELARPMIRRLVEETDSRTRLFSTTGKLLVDSRKIGDDITVSVLPPPRGQSSFPHRLKQDLSALVNRLTQRRNFPPYPQAGADASRFPSILKALDGEEGGQVWISPRQRLILTWAVPIQRYKQVLGVVLLSRDGQNVQRAMAAVRWDILRVFLLALTLTVMLSLYLASTIAHPLRRLALAAESVRRSLSRQHTIPDLTKRRDEIGDLSGALRTMTEALWNRMDAIERFAADVSHELKNPLCSLRSAVETVSKIKDDARREKLMEIIQHDVQRLDRLISDISNASRVDAELSRAQEQPVDIAQLLATLISVHADRPSDGAETVLVVDPDSLPLMVLGMETRLTQVFQNLLDNALSFSPADKAVRLHAMAEGDMVVVTVKDEGPGILPGKEEAIFERFYTERPVEEGFGQHSGLGLSISRQIVEVHKGTITAANHLAADGRVAGAMFTVRLPRL